MTWQEAESLHFGLHLTAIRFLLHALVALRHLGLVTIGRASGEYFTGRYGAFGVGWGRRGAARNGTRGSTARAARGRGRSRSGLGRGGGGYAYSGSYQQELSELHKDKEKELGA